MKLKKLSFALGACALLFICACESTISSDSSDNRFGSNVLFDTYSPDEISNEVEEELYLNFIWLDLAYLYAHTRNEIGDDYREYLGKGTESVNKVKGRCTGNYYDVCYMYNQMADPYTRYYDPNIASIVYKNVMESDAIVGIGAEFEMVSDSSSNHVVITQVYPNSPSDKAGLQEGDTIKSIDDIPITKPEHVDRLCSGEKGTTIEITVSRDDETVTADVILDEYNVPTVKVHYEDSIPVIEILEFTKVTINPDGTYGEFLDALEKTKGAKSTIIDLRRNLGGDVDHCNNVASEFLSAGDTILSDVMTTIDTIMVKGHKRLAQGFDTITYTAAADGLGKDRYYVLLSSDTSASCAEVVLSAVTVNRKFPVVGLTSYGKAIGQGIFTEEDASIRGIALITAMTGIDKNGESYQDLGIAPDYEISDPDEQMAKAVKLAKKAKERRTAGYGTKRLHHFAKARDNTNLNKPFLTPKDLKTRYKIYKKKL